MVEKLFVLKDMELMTISKEKLHEIYKDINTYRTRILQAIALRR